MSKILTLEDRIAMEKEAIENEKRIVEDALPYIFDKLIRSPRATWFNADELHSVTLPTKGGECRLREIRRVSNVRAIANFLNEQLALERNLYLKYPKVANCSFFLDPPNGGKLILKVFFERGRFSHLD